MKVINYFVSNSKSVARHTCALSQVTGNALTSPEMENVLHISSLNEIMVYWQLPLPASLFELIRTRNLRILWSGLIQVLIRPLQAIALSFWPHLDLKIDVGSEL